jgi:hypothetical protein
MLKQVDSLLVVYEYIVNLQRKKEDDLLADLEIRTGIKIKRYQIEKQDFLRDAAMITIFFDVREQNSKREINL